MHADEKNRALSEQLGRDVYQYHLHVVYVPVVEKEVRWTKKCKDKALVGTVKAVINQISHSKKWAFTTILDEENKLRRIPSYSILQTKFFEHMRYAGYRGFERGVLGSTGENLPTLAYKIKQDRERLAVIGTQITEQKSELDKLGSEVKSAKSVKATYDEISTIGRKKRFSDKVEMSADEHEKLQDLAKEGLAAQNTIAARNQQVSELNRRVWRLTDELDGIKEETKDYRAAERLAPDRVRGCFDDVFRQHREMMEREQAKRREAEEQERARRREAAQQRKAQRQRGVRGRDDAR